MNAPTTEVPPALVMFQDIALEKISVSQTQMQIHRRAGFDKEAMRMLSENVRQVGVIQPILVRPLGKGYELVAGERRFIAAGMAQLPTIPAMVRNLSDLEALELQVIENKQRENLHELIEAEGFEELMKRHKHTRLKLLDLCPDVRTAAMLLARIPVHDLQRQALKEVTTPRYAGAEPMSLRQAAEHMQQNYMLRLDQAPFKVADDKLVPKAGACGPCPKRTGNQVDLFPDVKSADTCTDPQCFNAKKAAHIEQQRKAAEAKGLTVITGKQAKELFPHRHSDRPNGYVMANTPCYAVSPYKEYGKLLGKDAPALTVIENPHTGELVEAWPESEVNKILRAKNIIKPAKKAKATKAKSAAPVVNVDEIVNQRLFMAVRAKFTGLDVSELRIIARGSLHAFPDADMDVVCALWGEKNGNYYSLGKKIDKLGEQDVYRLLFDLMILDELDASPKPEKLLAAAKRYKVDVDKVKAEVKAELKATAEAPKPVPAAKTAKKT